MRQCRPGTWLAMVVLAASPIVARSQTPQAKPDAEFDVVSIKPAALDNAFPRGFAVRMIMRSAPGDFRSPMNSVHALLLRAFELQEYQLLGDPSWTKSELFDIQAKGGEGRGPKDIPAMLRSMLRNRFALRTHTDTRDLPSYVLSPSRDDGRPGSRLKPASPECIAEVEAREEAFKSGQTPPPAAASPQPPSQRSFEEVVRQMDHPACGQSMMSSGANGATHLVLSAMPLSEVFSMISRELGGPVVDRTGLSGRFDVDLEFIGERGAFGGPMARPSLSATSPAADAAILPPPLQAALKEQLGLKVEKTITPVEVLVVDSVDRPTPD